MVEKEHRTRDGTFVEPGELSAKERARGMTRGARTMPLPVIRAPRPADAADADPAAGDDAPRSA